MPDELSTPAPAPSEPASNPLERYAHGDPGLLAEAMLAPGERLPDIEPEFLDTDALKVIRGLRSEGFQAYLVGGCVRDLLVGFTPKDFDIATSAHPGEIRAAFRNCRLIGRRFRLAHVYFRGGKIIEVATFRRNPNPQAEQAEAEQQAEEHLEHVGEEAEAEVEAEQSVPEPEATPDLLITEDNTFGTAEEDARRRDFTINGLFYDVVLGRVLDYVGGVRDLDRRLVRTIGDPEVRMREDPVRLLRAVRFACKLGFDIEPVTYAACEGAVEDLPRCAPPRLLEEIFKILRAGASAPSFKLLDALGATPVLLPALHAAMRRGGPELDDEREKMLAQVDARLRAGETLDDALLFAALLEPVARKLGRGEGGPDPVEQLLEDLVRGSRLPRRIADRVRHLLSAQKTFTGERRRKRSLSSFRRAPYFGEALTLFELRVAATGEGEEQLEAWREGTEAEGGEGEAPASSEGEASEGDRKRRRRRRRRRNGEPKSDAPGETAPGGEGS